MNKLTIWIFTIILIFSGCGNDGKSSNNDIKSTSDARTESLELFLSGNNSNERQ